MTYFLLNGMHHGQWRKSNDPHLPGTITESRYIVSFLVAKMGDDTRLEPEDEPWTRRSAFNHKDVIT